MRGLCPRCGIGMLQPEARCDWCGGPRRTGVPLWTAARRHWQRSKLAAALRRQGPIVEGLAVGTALHLLIAAVGVVADVTALWKMGFCWEVQWWWVLLPEGVQPWAFAVVRGAAYGGLAGWVAAKEPSMQAERASQATAADPRRSIGRQAWFTPATRWLRAPGKVTALVALVASCWDTFAGLDYQLVFMALGAAVGQVTSLTWRGGRGGGVRVDG